MKAKGIFIATLLVVDTFFVAYAYGFHSRRVLVIDPKLPALAPAVVKVKVDAKMPTAPNKKQNSVTAVKSNSANKSKSAHQNKTAAAKTLKTAKPAANAAVKAVKAK